MLPTPDHGTVCAFDPTTRHEIVPALPLCDDSEIVLILPYRSVEIDPKECFHRNEGKLFTQCIDAFDSDILVPNKLCNRVAE